MGEGWLSRSATFVHLLLINQIADRNSTCILHDSGQASLLLHPTRGLPKTPNFAPLEKKFWLYAAA